MRFKYWFLALSISSACSGGNNTPDASFPYAPWDPGLPEAAVMGSHRGLVPARGIIHLHSPYSWDACDAMPTNPDGSVKEDCLADLRKGLCTTAMDYAAITDHHNHFADQDWGPNIFLPRGMDQVLQDPATGIPFASRMVCPDGREILLFAGSENSLMPIMLMNHPAGTAMDRHNIYTGDDLATVDTFRSLGAVAWVAHSESKDLSLLQTLKLDGMEIYNLHAAIDPNIRPMWLNLPASGAIDAVAEFADSTIHPAPQPDLALLSFLAENEPSIHKWDALLAEGDRVAGSAGTDAHENALPLIMRDGERGDSYRRMMRWFSNVVLVPNANDPIAIKLAIQQERMLVVFELMGTPVGFDYYGRKPDGTTVEIGSENRVVDGVHLVIETPKVYNLDPMLPAPKIHSILKRVDQAGATDVADSDGEIDFAVTDPGAYRVEVHIVPHHLGPYLGKLEEKHMYADQEYVWIYSNPIYVRP
jgi:hypothetical protein